jgi:hypothetical protein
VKDQAAATSASAIEHANLEKSGTSVSRCEDGSVITGLAHTAVCVPDVDAAVDWYCNVLGLTGSGPPGSGILEV